MSAAVSRTRTRFAISKRPEGLPTLHSQRGLRDGHTPQTADEGTRRLKNRQPSMIESTTVSRRFYFREKERKRGAHGLGLCACTHHHSGSSGIARVAHTHTPLTLFLPFHLRHRRRRFRGRRPAPRNFHVHIINRPSVRCGPSREAGPPFTFKISMLHVFCGSHGFRHFAALFIDSRAE